MHILNHLNDKDLNPTDSIVDNAMTSNTVEESLVSKINILPFQQNNTKQRKDNFSDNEFKNIITDLNKRVAQLVNNKSSENNKANSGSVDKSASRNDLRLLVVEDDQPSQKVIYLMLIELGYKNIEIVETGLRAIEAFSRNKYDLVILDIGLPDIDGLAICKTIRKSTENNKAAIIAVTAFGRDEIEEKCYSSGINDIITKPVFIDELKIVLESWSELSPK